MVRTALSLLCAALVTASVAPSPNYIGCYQESYPTRTFSYLSSADNSNMTIPRCTSECKAANYLYAALQYSRECYCGNEVPSTLIAEDKCALACTGDSTTKCGGLLTNSVYSARYMGCFVDSSKRVLPQAQAISDGLTIEKCVAACRTNDYRYAGVQFGRECYCGGDSAVLQAGVESECSVQCTGNKLQTCGGFLRNGVHELRGPKPTQPPATITPIGVGTVYGKPFGFASGTTGGGTAEPVYPKDITELESLLKDPAPKVIVLNKEYNYLNSMGQRTEEGCRPSQACDPDTNRGGQDWLIRAGQECTSQRVQVTYDVAGVTNLEVSGDKTLIGFGTAGVIRGRGLRILGSNVIVQNVHITELNPHLVWGGDALHIPGRVDPATNTWKQVENIWIDHIKISLIGRQMTNTNFGGVKGLTISNSEYDGRTPYSSSCDGRHYWTFLFLGSNDHITLAGNYIHHTSGRAPKIGGHSDGSKQLVHFFNNYYDESSGHNMDVSTGGTVFSEGNFMPWTVPVAPSTEGELFSVRSTADVTKCQSSLGSLCQPNTFLSTIQDQQIERAPDSVVTQFQANPDFKKLLTTCQTAQQVKSAVDSRSSANFGVGALR